MFSDKTIQQRHDMSFPKGEAAAEIHKFRSNLCFRQPTLSDFGNPQISWFITVYQCLSSCFRRELWVHPTCSETATAQQLPAATFRSGCLQKLPVARGQRIGNGKAFFMSTMVPWPKTWPFLMVGVSWVTRSTMKYPRYAYWLTAAGLKRMSRYVEIDLDMRKSNKKEQLWMIKHDQWPKPAVHAKVWITPTCCWVMMSLQECRFCILMRQFTRGNAFSAHY